MDSVAALPKTVMLVRGRASPGSELVPRQNTLRQVLVAAELILDQFPQSCNTRADRLCRHTNSLLRSL
eukprot:2133857-Rhodomonas_salina.4